MSIESKAKTQIDVANICDDCMSNCGSCPYSKKWVSLEDAQKEITNLQECNKFWGGYAAALKIENEKLVAKIEAANKMTDYSIAEILQKWELGLIPKDSRVILLIPRNREQSPEIPMRDRERLSQSAESPLPTGKDTKVARVRDNSVPPRKENQEPQKHKIKVPWDFAGISETEFYNANSEDCLVRDCKELKVYPSIFCAVHKAQYVEWLTNDVPRKEPQTEATT